MNPLRGSNCHAHRPGLRLLLPGLMVLVSAARGHAQANARRDSILVAAVRATPASTLGAAGTPLLFASWFAQLGRVPATSIQWEVNDCGEGGDGRAAPTCVTARVALGLDTTISVDLAVMDLLGRRTAVRFRDAAAWQGKTVTGFKQLRELARWVDKAMQRPIAPKADTVPPHATFTIESRAVGERRTINVYTPPGYAASSRKSYPVLYMPDGGIAEDFPHVVITVDSLIRLRRIASMLVVGIENTQRRRDMTGPTTVASDSAIAPRVGGSAAFREFIRDELIPEVKRRYRTTDETAIVGESLAGLFIVETFLHEPALFRRYIALSPSVWWNRESLLADADQRVHDRAMRGRTLYLTAANEDGIASGTAKLAAILTANAAPGLTWIYEPRPDLEHSTIYLRQGPTALVKALR